MTVRTKDFLTPGGNFEEPVEVDVVDGLTLKDAAAVDQQWEIPMASIAAEMTLAGFASYQLLPSWA